LVAKNILQHRELCFSKETKKNGNTEKQQHDWMRKQGKEKLLDRGLLHPVCMMKCTEG
jgi:hypothetical protein